MLHKVAAAGVIAGCAILWPGVGRCVDVPAELAGTWLPLDGFARAEKPEDPRRTSALGTYFLFDDGEWDETGGGIFQACKYDEFKRTKSG